MADQVVGTTSQANPTYLPGVSDTSLLDRFWGVFHTTVTDSGSVAGGAGPDVILNSAASQDVPQGGDTRVVTDPTSTTVTPLDQQQSPGVFHLLWNSITGSGPGLFSCRPDSILCFGTGQQAKDAGIANQNPNGAPGGTNWLGSIQSTLIIVVIGLVVGLLIIKRVTP